MDPFDVLGISPRYAVDLVEVEKRHREMSRALHPDRFVGRPASERRMALSKAIEVNEAWRAIRDPVKRAEALFLRFRVDVGERKEPPAPPDLLMEMMELREALSDARASKDRPALDRLVASMRERERRVVLAIGSAFDEAEDNPDAVRALLPALGELRYVRRFLEEASAAEDELL